MLEDILEDIDTQNLDVDAIGQWQWREIVSARIAEGCNFAVACDASAVRAAM